MTQINFVLSTRTLIERFSHDNHECVLHLVQSSMSYLLTSFLNATYLLLRSIIRKELHCDG
jgi:hypothetical protein